MLQSIKFWNQELPLFNVMLGMGLLSVTLCVLYFLRKKHITGDAETRTILVIPLGFCCCALFAWLSDGIFRRNLIDIFNVKTVGLTFFGGLTGFLLFLAVYGKWSRLGGLYLMNLYLPLLALAQSWGRIGCFLGGCCFGKPTGSWWGICYPSGTPPYELYGRTALIPVQLLEAVFLGMVFLGLWFWVRFDWRGGMYLLTVGFGRFWFEFLRGDHRGQIAGIAVLSPAQILGIIYFILGIVLLIVAQYRYKTQRAKIAVDIPDFAK